MRISPGGPVGRAASLLLLLALGLTLVSTWEPGVARAAVGEGGSQLWLMPRVGTALEMGAYLHRPRNASGLFLLDVEADLLRYGRHTVYLQFQKNTTLGVPARSWEFNRVIFDMVTSGYRLDLGEHYLGLVLDHWCINNYR